MFVGGPAIHLSNFAYDASGSVPLRGPALPPDPAVEGVKGYNELVVAVSEDFGGWGVQAKVTDIDKLAFG